jgi:TPR repeat protein
VYTLIFFGVIGLIGKGCDSAKNKAPSAPSNLSAGASYPATPRYTPFPLPVASPSSTAQNITLQAASQTPYDEFIKSLSASEIEHLLALYLLGTKYADGIEVPKDYTLAAKYFKLAADQGYAQAQLKLGLAYHCGDGVPKNHTLAYMWYNIAAANGIKLAATLRGFEEKYMSSYQIQEAQRLSSEWSPQPRSTP